MPKVSLEAKFQETGLEKLGRNFDMVSQRVQRLAGIMKSWGSGGVSEKDIGQQFRLSQELENVHKKIAKTKEEYLDLIEEIKKTDDPAIKGRKERELKDIAKEGEKQLGRQQQLNEALDSEGKKVSNNSMLYRGMRLGLGALGLPMTIGAAARGLGEAQEQDKMVMGMAARLRDLNAEGQNFTDFTLDLRRNIVAAGAEFAYSGRESLQLADSLSRMAGGMVSMRDVLELARGAGMNPQAAGQYVALSRRFGGSQAPPDEKATQMLFQTMKSSGMLPRSDEFAQAISQAMQVYAQRLPSVDPRMLLGIFGTLSDANGVGKFAPTLRGAGGTQVIEGLTRMVDRNDEAMQAIQTEIVRANPGAFPKTLKELNMTEDRAQGGGGLYRLTQALKSAGPATEEGLKFIGEIFSAVTQRAGKDMAAVLIGELTGWSQQTVAQLDKGRFFEKMETGKFTAKEFNRQFGGGGSIDAARNVMETPAMAFSRLRQEMSASAVDIFENFLVRAGGEKGKGIGGLGDALADLRKENFPSGMELGKIGVQTLAHTLAVTVTFTPAGWLGEKAGEVIRSTIDHVVESMKDEMTKMGVKDRLSGPSNPSNVFPMARDPYLNNAGIKVPGVP